MPVLHEGEEWRGLLRKLDGIQGEITRMRGELTLLQSDQKYNHAANEEKIKDAKNEVAKLDLLINGDEHVPGLKTDMATLMAYGRATAFWAKAATGLLATILVVWSIYALWFEAHHKISRTDAQGAMGAPAPPQVTAVPSYRQ